MSLDLPASVERDIQQYAKAEHITANEAAVRLIQEALKLKKKAAKSTSPITDAELADFKKCFPALGKLDDVTDEQWERIRKGARRMSQEGLTARG